MKFNKDEAVAKLEKLGINLEGLEDTDVQNLSVAYDMGIEEWLKQKAADPRDYAMIRAVFVVLTDDMSRDEMKQTTVEILKAYADWERA